MAELLLRLRDREVNRVPVETTRVTIGRDPACNVVIDNPAVSRSHAVMIYVDKQFRIRDSSTGGLTVNGKAVRDSVLSYGDVIGIGKFELQLLKTSAEESLEVAPPKPAALSSLVDTVRPPPTAAKPAATTDVKSEAASPAEPAAEAKADPEPARASTLAIIDWRTIAIFAGVALLMTVTMLASAIWMLENGILNLE